jgi:hypothetical protein
VGVSTADADNDGDMDITFSSINGYHQCLLNSGDPGQPIRAEPTYMLSGGERFQSVWRTRPVRVDWDEDGQLDYICQNERGEVGMFPGDPNRAWNQLGDWIAWQVDDGQKIDPDGDNGMEGRAKIAVADWDADGINDLLIGTKGGTPWSAQQGRKDLSYVFFLKGIKHQRAAVFAKPRAIRYATGKDIELGDHTASPATATFFGDAKLGLLLGVENGRIHYYSQDELSW